MNALGNILIGEKGKIENGSGRLAVSRQELEKRKGEWQGRFAASCVWSLHTHTSGQELL